MGLETATQTPLGRIDPNSMIGLPEPVVTPSAVAALSDAFRKGVVTSDDIISRYGELAKTKKKSDLQTLEEGMSPEAVKLRHTTTGAQQSQQELAGQTAEAGKENLATQQEIERLGPFGKMGVETFMRLRNELPFTEMPVLKNGKTDWATVAEWGMRIGAQKMKKDEAFARMKDPRRERAVHNGKPVFMTFDSFGSHVTPEEETELEEIRGRQLSVTGQGWDNIKPGAVSPGVVPAAANIPALGDFHNPEIAAGATAPVVAGTAATTAGAAGEIIPGVGIVSGPVPTIARTNVPPPVELEQQLIELQKTGTDIQQAQSLIQGDGNNVVGPMVGNIITRTMTKAAAALGSDAAQHQINAQRNLEMLRSRKILEGAQKMKGNLSDKDIRFLQDTIPGLTDDEALWSDFLSKWEAMNSATQRVLKGELERAPDSGTYSMPDTFWNAPAPGAAAQSGSPAEQLGPIQTAPDGRKYQWDQSLRNGAGGYKYVDEKAPSATAEVRPNYYPGAPVKK